MPLDYDDVETDNAKEYDTGETSVDLDYKSNIKLEKDPPKEIRKKTMSLEKSEIELELTMGKLALTDEEEEEEEHNDSPIESQKKEDIELESSMNKLSLTEEEQENSENYEKSDEDSDEIISRAPVGGIPVTYANNYFSNTCYIQDGKPKRSYVDCESQAVKYKKPIESPESLLQMQCRTMPEYINQNYIINGHQPSGGTLIVSQCPSVAPSEEYDSSFSPGESIYDSPPPPVRVLSPASDYSSMASPPDNLDPSFIEVSLDLDAVKKENFGDNLEFDDIKLSDVNEIIEKDLNFSRISRIKEEKERLEKELSSDDSYGYSPPEYNTGSPSSYPPNNAALNKILQDLVNPAPVSQPQVFSQPQQKLPSISTYAQPQQNLINSSQCQYTQLQQQQLVTSPSQLPYNLLSQTNIVSNTSPQQHYPNQEIMTTAGNRVNQNQFIVSAPQVNGHQQSGMSNYPQQNQLSSVATVTNQHYISQQPAQILQSKKQTYPVTVASVMPTRQNFVPPQINNQHQYTVKPQPQIITTTSNQPFSLCQGVSEAKLQYTNSPPRQHVTPSPQGLGMGCTIQATQPVISQLVNTPINSSVVTQKTSILPATNVPDQNGMRTTVAATPTTTASPNNAVIIVTTPNPNSKNPIILLPMHVPVPPENKTRKPRLILPKKPDGSGDNNGNWIDLPKLASQTEKRKEKSSQPCEMPGLGNLGVARRCVAAMKDENFDNTSDDGDNYLHVAVCKTDVYMIEALLERLKRSNKLDLLNKQNHAQQTPVYLAVSANQPAMVHILIRYGADVNLKGMMHERVERAPIHCAASRGKEYYDTLKELFKSDSIDPDILNSDGLSALHCAIIEHGKLVPNQNPRLMKIDNCQNVTLLLKHKANPNLPDRRNGKTPLMYALEGKDYTMIETILKGVETSKIPELFSAKTFDGRTCVKIADGLRNEYDPQTWKKLHNFFSSVHH